MASQSSMTDADMAEALAYIESLLRALRGRLAAGRGGRKASVKLVATRFPAKHCRIVANEIAGTPEAGAKPLARFPGKNC